MKLIDKLCIWWLKRRGFDVCRVGPVVNTFKEAVKIAHECGFVPNSEGDWKVINYD